ncbi:carbohydrate ABC transporter permease [Paenibacillus albus]|uniref:carbohydrate ABC transporter permease n=1 Tax=Paenibacillus albus TaxID=2495582 RepID=UPI001D131B0E|nr:hypothetical protein [Paenibacillus albus]
MRRIREQLLGYLFLSPSLAVFVLFLFYPMVRSVYLSFQLTDPRGRVAAYAGFDNYSRMFQSSDFWNSLWITVKFTLLTVPGGLFSVCYAQALFIPQAKGARSSDSFSRFRWRSRSERHPFCG